MNRLRATQYLVMAFLALGAMTSEAKKSVKYAGTHPRTGKSNGGLCHIEFVHVHTSSPLDPALYRLQGDVWVFIGDPVPFGYDGPRHQYYGHHPVTLELLFTGGGDEVVYCYLDGPHWHAYEPPDDHKFVVKKDVHYYAGDYPPEYEREKARHSAVNVAYRPLVYERPVIVGPPPPEYHGPIIDVRVHIPAPVLGVHVGAAPAVIVHEHGHGKFKHKKLKHYKFKKFKGH